MATKKEKRELTEEERAQVSQAMSLLAKVSTPATKAARGANLIKAREARRRNPLDLPCVCSGGDSLKASDHKTTCPRGRLLWQRERAAQKRAEAQAA